MENSLVKKILWAKSFFKMKNVARAAAHSKGGHALGLWRQGQLWVPFSKELDSPEFSSERLSIGNFLGDVPRARHREAASNSMRPTRNSDQRTAIGILSSVGA